MVLRSHGQTSAAKKHNPIQLLDQKMQFQLNAPDVVEEVIDGEVMAINLVTGNYYNMQGNTARIWRCLLQGIPLESLVEHYVERFPGDAEIIRTELGDFIKILRSDQLISVRTGEIDQQTLESTLSEDTSDAWESLHLGRHTDMQELLLVDPIHEVKPKGWPETPENASDH